MLDERPPAEPPARASAIAGAKATLAQNNSASMMRQFGNRLAMSPLTQASWKVYRVDMVRAGSRNSAQIRNIVTRWYGCTTAPLNGAEACCATTGLLDPATKRAQIMPTNAPRDQAPLLGLVCYSRSPLRRRNDTTVDVQLAPAPGVRPF